MALVERFVRRSDLLGGERSIEVAEDQSHELRVDEC